MSKVVSALLAGIKGFLEFAIFLIICSIIAGIIVMVLGHPSGTATADLWSGGVAVLASALSCYLADLVLQATFKFSYYRKSILIAITVWYTIGILLDLALKEGSPHSTQHIQYMTVIVVTILLRFKLTPAYQWSRAAPTEENSFRKGISASMKTLGMFALIGLWILFGILQWAATIAQIESFTHVHGIIAFILCGLLAYTPLIGSIIGFFGAKDVWLWPWWQAGLLYFGFPLGLLMLSIIGAGFAEAGRRVSQRKSKGPSATVSTP